MEHSLHFRGVLESHRLVDLCQSKPYKNRPVLSRSADVAPDQRHLDLLCHIRTPELEIGLFYKTAPGNHFLRAFKLLQTFEGGFDHIMWIVRTETL